MKYLKLFEGFNEMRIICRKLGIINYIINKDEYIDVDDSVSICSRNLIKLPLNFNKVNGYFDCSVNKLESFKGFPKIIKGNFYCGYNNIKTFKYFPNYVKGYFYCNNNPIFHVWKLFQDCTKIELLNDCDIFRDDNSIIIDKLNNFLLKIGKDPVEKVTELLKSYKII